MSPSERLDALRLRIRIARMMGDETWMRDLLREYQQLTYRRIREAMELSSPGESVEKLKDTVGRPRHVG